jgi:hypothetical protein
MYELFRQALLLNNEGVERMAENRDQEAVELLTKSLTLVKQILAASEAAAASESQSSSSSPKAMLHQQISLSLAGLHDQHCFIYSHPVAFALDEEGGAVPDQDTHIYSAVIILNLALIYHRKGLSLSSAACLLKAERMYDMCLSLLSGSCPAGTTALLVKFAALNNLSQLKHMRGEYQSSLQGFQYLGSLLGMSSTSVCDDTIYQGMLLNVLCTTVPQAAGAA